MIKVQIIEDETLQGFADFENAEVWLLSKRYEDTELDGRLIVVEEIAASMLPASHKLPKLMTEIYGRHPNAVIKEIVKVPKIGALDENGLQAFVDQEVERYEVSFTYEVLTHSKESLAIRAYVCDEDRIRVVPEGVRNA